MSGQIVPKRFGLKYSPKPAIALEYQKPDSGLAILEVVIEQLSPGTYDVEGVVDALQKDHPSHLGPNMVSVDQLERLVARLLFEGRAHLPEDYPTPTRMIIEGPQEPKPSSVSSSPSSYPSHEPPTKPSRLPGGDEFSAAGALSGGPTPAPTPEMQRTTRNPSDGSSSATNESRSPRGGNGSDDVGAEDERCSPAMKNTNSVVRQASRNSEGPRLPTAIAVNTAAVASLGDRDVRGWDDDEENSRGEGDEEGEAREQEGKRSDNARGGARDGAEEDSREEAKELRSFSGVSSEAGVKHTQHETLKRENGEFHDHRKLDDEIGGYGQHRRNESKPEPQSISPKSFSTVTAATATVLDKEPGRENSTGDFSNAEGETEKEKLLRGEEREEGREEEEEVPEIEDEDDDIPEDVESEELYETGSSHADSKDDEGQSDGGDNEPRSKEDASSKEVGGTDNDAHPFTSSRDAVGIAVGKLEAFTREDERTDGERARPRVTSGEESGAETPTTPAPVSSPLRSSPTMTSPTAAPDTTPPSQGSRQEERSSPSLSSPLAPARGLAPAPSSPQAVAGIGASPLAGLPLPPMGDAHPRLGLLGSLPPVGGRGLPSLALPRGKKTMDAREEGEKSGDGVGRAGGGESEDDDARRAIGVTDALVSSVPSPLGSPRWSATPSPVAERDTAAGGRPDPSHLSRATGGDLDEASDPGTVDKGGDDSDVLDELTRLSLTTRGEGENNKKDEEATLRARLGFGEDEEDDEEGEEDEEDGHVEPEWNGDEGSLGGRENNNASSSPGSPKQHQGQEEENAGRMSPSNDPRDEEDKSAAIGGGAGGDYFGDSDEASSVGEDISFEQESVDGDGGGDGSGSDDYFS